MTALKREETAVMEQLTAEEAAFLLLLLERVQLSGTPAQVKETLRLVDSISAKVQQPSAGSVKE